MGYINTGYQRATTLTIITKVNGVQTASNVLPFMEQFVYNGTTYPAVDETQIAQMEQTTYDARVNAYAAYVQANYQNQYPGLTVTSAGSHPYNATVCPLP